MAAAIATGIVNGSFDMSISLSNKRRLPRCDERTHDPVAPVSLGRMRGYVADVKSIFSLMEYFVMLFWFRVSFPCFWDESDDMIRHDSFGRSSAR